MDRRYSNILIYGGADELSRFLSSARRCIGIGAGIAVAATRKLLSDHTLHLDQADNEDEAEDAFAHMFAHLAADGLRARVIVAKPTQAPTHPPLRRSRF